MSLALATETIANVTESEACKMLINQNLPSLAALETPVTTSM